MIETQFTQLVGATAPIQAAAMPGVPTIALVAAVANPGAVEMLGAPLWSPALYEANR
jgi:NAD(P)H-dependent flavin oxidoreductase YrpB (nitropropane dioxygenase family)